MRRFSVNIQIVEFHLTNKIKLDDTKPGAHVSKPIFKSAAQWVIQKSYNTKKQLIAGTLECSKYNVSDSYTNENN